MTGSIVHVAETAARDADRAARLAAEAMVRMNDLLAFAEDVPFTAAAAGLLLSACTLTQPAERATMRDIRAACRRGADAVTAAGGGIGGQGGGGGGVGGRPATSPETLWKQRLSDVRRQLMGKEAWPHVRVLRVLGSGCNGTVFEAEIGGAVVAVKAMYNFGQTTTMASSLHETEYRFLRRVPEHFNILAVLGVIQTSPLTAELVQHLPAAIRELVTVVRVVCARARLCPRLYKLLIARSFTMYRFACLQE